MGSAIRIVTTWMRALTASIFFVLVIASGASAQKFPERPVTIVVAFAPGGADDATARILQDPMQRALGQPIVVENVSGAGGMIAAAKVAHAEPDGHTILLHQDALAAGMSLYPERTFDAENDFEGLLRWRKEPGQTIRAGHPGVGSFGHLAEVLIFQEFGVKVTQVPYRGAGPALVDLLAGQVDLGPISAVVATPLVNS